MSYISVDVDIDDIISAMGRWDRRVLFERLQESGYIPESCIITDQGEIKIKSSSRVGFWEDGDDDNDQVTTGDFDEAVRKLQGNSWRLTPGEEQFIINLANKF